MNRSLRTKLTALGLCVTLMFTALTGCGNKGYKGDLKHGAAVCDRGN